MRRNYLLAGQFFKKELGANHQILATHNKAASSRLQPPKSTLDIEETA
jgi:hypothetical protein